MTGKPTPAESTPSTDAPAEQPAPQQQAPQAPQAASSAPQRPGMHRDERPAPKRVRGGIKLNAPEGEILALADDSSRSIVRQWLECVDRTFTDDVREEGMRFAETGQTVRIEYKRARIEAVVQGRATRPYTVEIHLPELTTDDWARLAERMAGEAKFAAGLLAGELPTGFDAVLAELNLNLVPSADESLRVETNSREMRESGLPCSHAATATYIAAQQLARDPLLMFTLRGMSVERLLERIRETRTLQTRGESTAHAEFSVGDDQHATMPLEAMVDEFWGSSAAIHELEHSKAPHHVPHALLRRLGPSTLEGRFPFVGLLASIYDTVAESAVHSRDRAEHIEDDNDN